MTETPIMRYKSRPYVNPNEPIIAKAGDIAYWDGSSVKTVVLSEWNSSLGTPVGVVVIPSGFAPDGKVRIVSLKPVDKNGNQSDTHVGMKWGIYDTDTSLPNYTRFPTTDNAGSTSTGSAGYGYLPTDKFVNEVNIIIEGPEGPEDPEGPEGGIVYMQSYVDPLAYYKHIPTPNPSPNNFIPSPYLGDAPNPEYYKEIPGYNNALSDFNGLSNTQPLVGIGSGYEAANAAWKYKDGASNLQWYLPAMGELGYLMPRFNLIKASLTAVGGVTIPIGDYFWSSSEYDSDHVYHLSILNSYVVYDDKNYNSCIRPFATID